MKALFAAMGFAARQTDIEGWQAHLDEGFALAESLDDAWGIAQGLVSHGLIKEYFENDIKAAESVYRRALEYVHKLDDTLFLGQSLGPLASCALKQYEYERADEIYRESLSLFREVENTKEIAGAYGNLAEVALSRRDYESARTSAEESLALYRELEDKHGVATALRTLSYASHNQGNIQQAQMAAEQGVTLFRQLGDRGCHLRRDRHTKNPPCCHNTLPVGHDMHPRRLDKLPEPGIVCRKIQKMGIHGKNNIAQPPGDGTLGNTDEFVSRDLGCARRGSCGPRSGSKVHPLGVSICHT